MEKVKIIAKRFFKMFLFAFVIWFILNPSFEKSNVYLALCEALIVSVFFVGISHSFVSPAIFDFFFKKDFYLYILFMFKEIILASLEVLRSILTVRYYKSAVIAVEMPSNLTLGKKLLIASSITLTPGTSVVLMEENVMHVHCIVSNNCAAQQTTDFMNKILAFKF